LQQQLEESMKREDLKEIETKMQKP
jgi:hypothetical protein